MKKIYVTMTDSFMSGWGCSEGKINKLVFECDGYAEADAVERTARKREEMKYINRAYNKPWYSPKTHYVQFKNKEVYPGWYK